MSFLLLIASFIQAKNDTFKLKASTILIIADQPRVMLVSTTNSVVI